jgi:hypothetical protein
MRTVAEPELPFGPLVRTKPIVEAMRRARRADSAAIGTAANSLLRHAGVLPHRIVGAVNHVNAPHRVTVIVLRDRV